MVEPPSSRTGSPHDHLQQRGSKIDAFRGELVDVFASIGGRLDLVNDPLDSEFLKAVGEEIRGDSFASFHQIRERVRPLEHEVPDHQQ